LRIVWVVNLFVIFLTLLLLLFTLPFLLGAWFSEGSFSAVGCAVGCGLALPLGFVAAVLVLAMMVAQICAVEEGATVLGATRRGFAITGSRIGGLLLLYLLLILGSIAVTTFFAGLGLIVNLTLSHLEPLRTILAAALGFVEFVLSVGLTLTMTAAIVALVRSEMRMEPAAPRPDA
jgi:hypothetical protein